MRTHLLQVRTGGEDVVLDLTDRCASFVQGLGDGLLHVFVPHATAGIAILETGAGSDDDLLARAQGLNDRYLGGLATPDSVRWVDNQSARWGSCTPGDRSIRLSTRLRGMPRWVVDYVLVHELAHLIEPGHDERFWGWVNHYPKAERARGYLLGWSAAAQVEPPPGQEAD